MRGARASSVIVQHVPQERVDDFLAWQRGITGEASRFAGYQGTEVFPPTEPTDLQWAIIVHFDDEEALQRWLASPARGAWTAKLSPEIALVRMKTLADGFGPWFGDGGDAREAPSAPASWKMVLTVLLALYPTVMLLALVVGPHTSRFGLALSMLIGNALSCVLLQWSVMPVVERGLRPWLRATGEGGRRSTVLGAVAIVGALAALVWLFQRAASGYG